MDISKDTPVKEYFTNEDGKLESKLKYICPNKISEKDDEWFLITDEEYSIIMEIMNKQMKEECGSVPDLSYGVTNYDRLVKFANFPFAPELNEFSFLISNDKPSSYTEYFSSAKLEVFNQWCRVKGIC